MTITDAARPAGKFRVWSRAVVEGATRGRRKGRHATVAPAGGSQIIRRKVNTNKGDKSMTWKPGQAVRIETERTVLRSMTPADVTDRFVAWFRDPDVMANIAMPTNLSRQNLLRFQAGFDNTTRFLLGIFMSQTELHIGWLRFLVDRRHDHATTTTMIGDRDYWGRGLGYEVRAAAIAFMFEQLDLHKVIGLSYAENDRTHAINDKLGFRREGVLVEHERGRDGSWRDVHVYGLLAEWWACRTRTGPTWASVTPCPSTW